MSDEKKGFLARTADFFLGPIPQEQTIDNATPTQVRSSAATVPPARPSYSVLTPESALGIGAVQRAVSIISTSVAQMDLEVHRDGAVIPSPALIKTPDVNQSQGAFVQETVTSLALHGNAYWRLYRGSNGAVLNVEVLDPDTVSITKEKNKKVYYIGTETIPAQNIKHLKLFRRPGHDFGYGPVQMNKDELQAALRLRDFVAGWFDKSGIPTGMLTTDMVLNPEEARAFAEAWKDFLRESGGTAVMSQGLRYEALMLKPAEAQFVEVQQEAIKSIARIFGITAMDMLAELGGTSQTYLNLEQSNMTFMQKTLSRYMNEIEDALSDLLPRGQKVRFKEEMLLRMDTKTKVEVQKTQIEAGLRTANELRAEEGLAPLATPKPEINEEAGDSNGNGEESI